jgi:hypothetical protein
MPTARGARDARPADAAIVMIAARILILPRRVMRRYEPETRRSDPAAPLPHDAAGSET